MISYHRIARMTVDSASWILAGWLAVLLRYDGKLPNGFLADLLKFNFLSVIIALLVSSILSLYIGKYRNSSLEEFLILALANAISVIIIFCIRIILGEPQLPRSVSIISGIIALIFILISRVLVNPRVLLSYKRNGTGERTLIYGAGIAGRQLAEQMIVLKNEYDPIGFLDDDPSKSNLRILGRPVFGGIDHLEKIAKTEFPRIMIVAISGISSASLLDIEARCRTLGIIVRIIPTAHEIVSGAMRLSDVEDISEEDLLGRRPVSTSDLDIAKLIRGKRVLITGAGGSIGSEIARQVHRYSPLSMTLIDRDETALLNLQLSIDGSGLFNNKGLVLGDIRDLDRMFEIFQDARPDIVFHAAALKHLTTLQRFPKEAMKTNILGTRNVLKASEKFQVNTFVNISSDKAADPSSILGLSKLISERMTASIQRNSTKFISVRFGNVIGSNGSFIHTFRFQIRHGGPVTVTHPDVTRYFMTVTEAVHLVLQSAIIGKQGETLILDMGEPVSIDSIARHMIGISGRKVELKYTGLREGEKLHEVLISSGENVEIRNHPFIMHTRVGHISEEELEKITANFELSP
jgi:FlaA1/EpsC-like NDP-sugar epimerase